MSVLRPQGRLSFSSLFLAAAKSHPCVSGQKRRSPNVFSNISAFQMMNFLLSLCVALKKPITPGVFFPWVWRRHRNSRLTLVWSSSYLLFRSFHFFYAESIFFISSFFSNRRSLNSCKITYLYQGSDCEFILFGGSREIM